MKSINVLSIRAFTVVCAAVFVSCTGLGSNGSDKDQPDDTSQAATYSITYNGNGATAGSVPQDSVAYKAGQTVTVFANIGNLVKTGSTFTGWNTKADASGTTYGPNSTFSMPERNITLYARWTTNPTYTVTYNDNGSTSGSVPVDTTGYEVGQTVTVSGNTGNLAKTDCTFAGWNTQAGGDGTDYAPGKTFSMGSSNVTLYAKWGTPGGLDSFFDPGEGANDTIRYLAIQSDGKILIGGNFTAYNGTARHRLARLNSDGSLDTSFDPGAGADSTIQTLAIQSDGKIVIGGDFTTYNGTTRNRIARVNADGSLDTSFDPGTGADSTIQTLAIQGDGQIMIGGDFTTYNGTTRTRIARIAADGSLGSGFDPGSGADAKIYTLSLQSDGAILISGNFYNYNTTSRMYIARVATNGALDTTFDPGTGASGTVMFLKQMSGGEVMAVGGFTNYNGTARRCIARINADGTLDTTFNPGSGTDSMINTLTVQADAKILIGGQNTTYNGTSRYHIARVNTDGSLDTGFDPGTGTDYEVNVIALQSDGKIIIGGVFTTYNGTSRNRLARIFP